MSTFTLYWTSESRQGSINMGEFATRGEAEAAISAAEAEMLDQALDDDPSEDQTGLMTKSAVLRGSWDVDESD